MKRQSFKPSHGGVASLFTFLLIAIFALLSLFLVVIGADAYRGVTDVSSENADSRTALAYCMGKIRSHDAPGQVFVREEAGVSVLVLLEDFGEAELYETQLYCHEGYLMERLAMAGEPFEPEAGEALIPADGLDVSRDGDDLFAISVRMADGRVYSGRAGLRSGG